jgi:hypothetical protein
MAKMGEGDVSDPKFIILSHDSNRVAELVALNIEKEVEKTP